MNGRLRTGADKGNPARHAATPSPEAARVRRSRVMAAAAQAAKKEGNKLFTTGKHKEAIAKYTEAINLDGTDVTFFSNRSAAYAALEMWDEAAEDGRSCVKVNKNFIKGYFRLAVALRSAGKYKEAVDNIKMGLAVDPGNADLKKQSSEMEELMRKDRVVALVAKAKEQMQGGELKDCLATCDRGLALDGGNKELTKIKGTVQPKFEASEKRRVGSLSKNARDKELGDQAYKTADFEGAIKLYTKCLDATSDKGSEIAVKAYSNRAACYKQLSNFDGTIEDCTAVLDADPENVKSLVRRAQAFEAVERYKSALQDVKFVLQMPPPQVGQANWTLCNQMQHRLNRVVAQLKAGM
jgi:stress-induced-phosphoprotein 1